MFWGGARTALVLRSKRSTHTLSAAPFQCLTLREKVFAMQAVNAFVAGCEDGGECGGGTHDGGVTQPLLG